MSNANEPSSADEAPSQDEQLKANPSNDPDDGPEDTTPQKGDSGHSPSQPFRDPSHWKTGNEPMTPAQRLVLEHARHRGRRTAAGRRDDDQGGSRDQDRAAATENRPRPRRAKAKASRGGRRTPQS